MESTHTGTVLAELQSVEGPVLEMFMKTAFYGKEPTLEQGKSARKKDLRGECCELTTALIPHPSLVEDVGEL